MLGAMALTPERVSLTTVVIPERPLRASSAAVPTRGVTWLSASITLSIARIPAPPAFW